MLTSFVVARNLDRLDFPKGNESSMENLFRHISLQSPNINYAFLYNTHLRAHESDVNVQNSNEAPQGARETQTREARSRNFFLCELADKSTSSIKNYQQQRPVD